MLQISDILKVFLKHCQVPAPDTRKTAMKNLEFKANKPGIVGGLFLLAFLIVFIVKKHPREEPMARQQSQAKSSPAAAPLPQPGGKRSAKATTQKRPEPYVPPPEVVAVRGAWQPLTMNLELKRDVQAGMQLTSEELASLRKTLDDLLAAAGVIQAEDALISQDGEGNPLIFLSPVPGKWTELEEKFEADLKNSIGDAKAAYFLKSGALALEAITGDFGKTPRLIRIKDNREFKAAVPNNPRIKNWVVGIAASEMAQMGFRDYFRPETRSEAPASSNYILFDADMTFDTPPPFLQPLIEMEK
jgi:hypothetical protein